MLQGEITFQQVHQGNVLTSKQIYHHLMKMLVDGFHPSLWNAGYIMGWTKAYHSAPPSLYPLPASALAEQPRQQEIACLLEYIKAGEMILREAVNAVDGVVASMPVCALP